MNARRRFLLALIGTLVAPSLGAAPTAFHLPLEGGKHAGDSTLRIKRGDKVELRWTSDRPIVLHLHGYDLEVKAAPGAPAVMAFTAAIAGRFPVTEHSHGRGHHRAILYLEVHP